MPYKDPEKRREYNRKYNAEHRERIIYLTKKWQKAHPERKRANDRAYRLRHPEKIKARKRKWEVANREKRNAKNAEKRMAFFHDCAAWAKWRAGWRIIYAKRVIRRGETYSPRFDLRFPDYATKGSALDTRSAFLAVNMTPSQNDYARELAIERRKARYGVCRRTHAGAGRLQGGEAVACEETGGTYMKAICPVCGKEFTASVEGHAGRTKLCCSSACKWKRLNRIRHGQPVAETEYRAFCEKRKAARLAKLQRVCAVCGKEFHSYDSNARFCSISCSNRARATSMVVGRNVSASKARNAAPNITFVQKSEPQERSSIARVEAYLRLPASERYAQRDTLTKKEQAMARDLWLKIKCQRPVYHSAMAN